MFKYAKHLIAATLAIMSGAVAAAEPKIAVTDLTYEEKVSEYFHVVSANSKSSLDASGSERETDRSYTSRGRVNAKAESNYYEAEGVNTYIDRGELRTYTADLKGALLKGGGVRLVQARPYVGKPTDKIYDIVARIKQGFYPGADYVLFGTVSNIAFRQESMPLAMGSSTTANLTLDLVADFSLINTRTYEVKAAFSASGSGQDTKIVSRAGDRVVLNRSKVIQETSRTLADNAYAELMTQFGVPRTTRSMSYSGSRNSGENQVIREQKVEPVMIYR